MWRRLGAVVASTILATLAFPAPASAHATLISTAPADGSHLDRGTAQIVFTLDEPVSVVRDSPQVIDRDGTRHPVAGTYLNAGRTVVTVRLVTALPDGSFLATARLLSPDTHVVSVSAAFTVGTAAGLLTAPADREQNPFLYALKLLVYTGAVLSAGVRWTTTRLWPHLRRHRRWQLTVRWGGALLAVGLTGRLAVEASQRSGGVTHLSAAAVRELVSSGFGLAALATLIGLVALAAPPERPWRLGRLSSSAAVRPWRLARLPLLAAVRPWRLGRRSSLAAVRRGSLARLPLLAAVRRRRLGWLSSLAAVRPWSPHRPPSSPALRPRDPGRRPAAVAERPASAAQLPAVVAERS
ncbi:copper resistance CopC family protein, partial [Actinoplanes ianthinogenes]